MQFPVQRLIVPFLILINALQQGAGQDSFLIHQLKQSHYLQTLMKPDSSGTGFSRWKKREIIRSTALPLVTQFYVLNNYKNRLI